MSEQLLRYEAVMKEKTESENLKKVVDHQGLKHDTGKQPWFAMPLVVLKPLADVFAAGEKKYETFNCLQPFEDSDRRFWDATMRHLEACQLDPLAKDEETGCYHAAQACFNLLLRIHNARASQ